MDSLKKAILELKSKAKVLQERVRLLQQQDIDLLLSEEEKKRIHDRLDFIEAQMSLTKQQMFKFAIQKLEDLYNKS